MIATAKFIEFLLIGAFSTIHCLVMCGAIVGALTITLPLAVREQKGVLSRYLLAYNAGRIVSYAAAGFLAGLFGEALVRFFELDQRHSWILMGAGSILLVGIGLHVAGWLPGMALFERGGDRLWRLLEPLAQALLPVTSLLRAFVFGLIWGWFPCGLTYAVLLWAATTGKAVQGALAMVAFGVGTLPVLFLSAFFSGRLLSLRGSPRLRRGFGAAVVALALVVGVWELRHVLGPPADTPALIGSHPSTMLLETRHE